LKRFKFIFAKIYLIIFFIECGGIYTAPQGTIHTKNYPQYYNTPSSCIWYIEIAKNHLINLTFVDFSIWNSKEEGRDKVLVYDDDDDINRKLLLSHYGNSNPLSIISSSNKLLVYFEAVDNNVRARGFKAIYSTVIYYSILFITL